MRPVAGTEDVGAEDERQFEPGQQPQRRTDDFWTAPENVKKSVEATDEAALLEIVSLTVR